MEYTRDLLKKEPMRLQKWMARLGLSVFYLIAGLYLVLLIKGNMNFLHWFNFVANLLIALLWTIALYGYNPERLMGKAYIHINTEVIDIKTSLWEKKQMVKWKEIRHISYRPGKYDITTNSGQTIMFSLSKLEYQMLMEVKEAINRNAEWHGLEVEE